MRTCPEVGHTCDPHLKPRVACRPGSLVSPGSWSGPAGLVECPLFGSCPGQLSWLSWLSSGERSGQRGLCG